MPAGRGQGRLLLPSVVHYLPDGQIVVGKAQGGGPGTDPRNTIVSVKALHGRVASRTSPTSRPCPTTSSTPPAWCACAPCRERARSRSPPRSSRLRLRAERSLGGELTGAVITVPAYFDDAQRQATKDAAASPASTCCACSTSHRGGHRLRPRQRLRRRLRGYDLGGGTFDISVCVSRGVFEVVATSGDAALGGDDFDHRLFCWILDNAGISLPSDRDARRLLMRPARSKERLT